MQRKSYLMEIISSLSLIIILVLVVLLGNSIRNVETLEDALSYRKPALTETTQAQEQSSRTLRYSYVPAYSHIYSGGGQPQLLEVTLSVRNTDPSLPLTLHKISYHDSEGRMLKKYIDTTSKLPAMATAEYLVEIANHEGGSGANFVILWSSERDNAKPIFETVMIATEGKPLSFTSSGQEMPFSFAD